MRVLALLLVMVLPHLCLARTYVVDANHPKASDRNPGTEELPFKTIGRAVTDLKPGDVVLIKAGVYRESVTIKASGTKDKPIVIKACPRHEGKAIIKGSEIFREWKQIPGNPVWVALWKYRLDAHYPQEWEDFGPYAKRCEMVFVDGRPLKQVPARGLLMMNTFFVDDENGKLYIAVPYGTSLSRVEVAVRQRGIFVRGSHLRFKGLTVMYVANHHKEAAFDVIGRDIVIEGCWAEWNNLDGFRVAGRNNRMIRCVANHNGRCGISASIHDSVLEGCVTDENSWRFGPLWHSGGVKVVGGAPSGNRIIGHIARNNNGKGIWFDYGCKNNLVERCFLHGNLIAGLEFEACLEGNVAVNNVICHTRRWRGSLRENKTGVGIMLYETLGTRLIHNTIFGNEGYGILIAGGKRRIHYTGKEAVSRGIFILNNIIAGNGGAGLGFWVWDESAKLEAIASHWSDFNLWWRNGKGDVELPPHGNPIRETVEKWAKSQDAHSLHLDPKFANPKKYDFRLLAGSPAIDRAKPLKEVKVDFEGKRRFLGKAPDIGAFESSPAKGK
ncbi:right-handed parallel beta-helix repeat-containing protein [Candidatus Poribacteria bacterium]|nr:right-handed parallel beta-helix repeat-containing protein [Candidatus Poribacteria bacterium]